MEVHRYLLACLVGVSLSIVQAAHGVSGEPIVAQQKVGDRVHDFELPIVGSKDLLQLSEEYRQGPVVVVVLRGDPGYQCQLCVRQLASLSNRSTAIKPLASRIILVYPGDSSDLEQRAKRFKGSRRLPEPLVIVRDDQMKMVRQWGLRWDKHHETAYPATYVIDRNGDIRWKKVSRSHAGRSTVEEILKELRTL